MAPYILPSVSGGLLISALIVYHAGLVHGLQNPVLWSASFAFGACTGFYTLFTTDDRPVLRVTYLALTVISAWLGIMGLTADLSVT